jgi:glutamine amidotransferase-like uncharacterized protein
MEVEVVTGMVPLSDEFRNALKPAAGTPLTTTDDESKDLNKVDFAPGAGFDTDKVAAGIKPLPGTLRGSGSTLWLDPTENNSFRVITEAMNTGSSVVYDVNTRKYGVQGANRSKMQQWVNNYAINGVLGSGSGSSKVKTRIGVYRPWTASMDMGWTRWLLDNFGFGYACLRNSDFMADNLEARFDVIVMASEWPGSIENGLQPGSAPPQYAGGLGELGVRNLNNFVEQGGTLITLNRSSDFAIKALHLPVKNVVDHIDRAKFFTGGSIMQVETNVGHPVMAGMPEKANVFVYNSPVFSTGEGFEGEVLAKYQEQGSPLMSGFLVGESYLNGNAAALDVKHGNGHVLLFGFQPQWRGQPMGTYRTLFNALLYANQIPNVKREIPKGWDFIEGSGETKVSEEK